MGIEKPSDSASNVSGRPDVVVRSQKTPKRLLVLDHPKPGLSSSTPVDVSSTLLSNVDTTLTTVGPEVLGGLSVASMNFVKANGPKESVDHFGSSNVGVIIDSERKGQMGCDSTGNGLEQHHTRRLVSSANHPRSGITEDTSTPPKVAGNRRKRERIKSSGNAVIEIDDESTPPCKKSRGGTGIRKYMAKSNETLLDAISIPGAKRCAKTAKGSSPSTDPTMVDFDELPEPKPFPRGSRKSSRIKTRHTAAAARTRVKPTRTKGRKGKDIQSASDIECKELTCVSLKEPIVKINHDKPSISRPQSVPTSCRKVTSPNVNCGIVSNNPSPATELNTRQSTD